VTDTSPTDLPSRRELREAGMTGPIDIPSGPPLTRRERKMREQLEATGALPVIHPGNPPTPEVTQTQPTIEQPAAPVVTVAPSPIVAASPAAPAGTEGRPLTRRELREQLRTPAKDTAAVAAVAEDVAEREEIVPSALAPNPVSREVEEKFSWQLPLEEMEASPSESSETPVATPAPLPPVFGTIPAGRDTPTAAARTVSTAAPATNALILPVAPSIDVTGPLTDTGEVIVTGSIPLRRLVAETGVTGVLDVDDDDDFMEADSGPYTAPISASLAVSSRSLELDQPMIQKPRVGAVSLALGVSAAILGITAVSLLALALLTDIIRLPF
jgi:hypothetical protein